MTWMRWGSSPAQSRSCMKGGSLTTGRSPTSRVTMIGWRRQDWSCHLLCACGHSQVRCEYAIDVRSALLELRNLITTRAMEPCCQGARDPNRLTAAHYGL